MANSKTTQNSRSRGRLQKALTACLLLLAPYIIFAGSVCAQTEPPPPGQGLPGSPSQELSQGAARTESTLPERPYSNPEEEVPLVQEIAEQNKDGVIYNVENMLRGELGAYNETYLGLHQWFADDWISNLFTNIGQLIGKWLTEFIEGWVADAVQFLTYFLRIFVLNPNIAVNGNSSTWGGDGSQRDDISPYIRQAADVMYGIAVDLLLLLFILCIWKYWADAAWRGGGNLMGAVGRLVFTAGLLLAWPTIYAFEIQITNEMIKAIYFSDVDQVTMLDAAMASAVKGGLVAGAAMLAHIFAPVAGAAAGGAIGAEVGGLVLGTVGEIVSFAGLIIFMVLGGILVAELIYMLVLKAIQTALLTAQYMFAPIFLVFFATPDTENVTSGFVRSFVEVSLWTFVWVGLLKVLVIVLYSEFNPWGKILMAVGILQLMIQVPSFLARAQISPMSDFISAGLITGLLLKGATTLSGVGAKAFDRFTKGLTDYPFAMGAPQSQTTTMAQLKTKAGDPELLTGIRAAAQGAPLPGQPGTGVPTPPLSRSAHTMASPGLNTPQAGQQPETEEERKKREEQELLQRALMAQQAHLAGRQGATPGVVPPGTQQAAGLQTPGAAVPGMPGGMNTPLANALTGLAGVMARNLSPAGIERGMVDTTTGRVPPGMQQDQRRLDLLRSMQQQQADLNAGLDPGEAAAKLTDSGVINPADKFNHAGYKFVQAKIAAVDARTYNGNSIGYSTNGQNALVGDGKGNLRHMRARKGASPEEVAHLVLAAGFTELFKEDPEALDAARQAALDAGEDGPQGLKERMAAGWIGYNGGSFRQTALAKTRFARALFQHAALGSEAYINGQKGNAYSDYLSRRFGPWSDRDDTWGVHILTDAASPESPWNPSYVPGTDSLFAVGLPITEDNRAASTNPFVMKLPMWQRKTAIPAVARYVSEIAKSQYANADPMVLAAAVGRIAPAVSNEEVESAFAIQVESNGTDVNVANVQSVSRLVQEGAVQDATNGYHALRVVAGVIGGFAVSGPRRGTHQAVAHVTYGSNGGSQPPHINPNQIPIPGNIPGQSGPAQVDVVLNPLAGNNQGGNTVQHLHMQAPGGNGGDPGLADVRIVGGGNQPVGSGTSGGAHVAYVDMHAQASGGSNQPPRIDPQEIERRMGGGPLSDPNRVMRAEHLIMDMHNAGFRDEQIMEPAIVQVAYDVHQQAPQMLNLVQVAAKVMGPADIHTSHVHTIAAMVDAGFNPNQIDRPDVWTAQAILQHGGYPTPKEVERLRLDERFIPRPGARLPERIVGDPNGPPGGSGRPA